MTMTSATVPHLMIPLQLAPGGSAATVEQDTLAEVTQSVAVLLGTTPNTRTVVPDYGIDPTFTDVDEGDITDLVAEWEPRAQVAVKVAPSETGAFAVSVAVSLADGGSE